MRGSVGAVNCMQLPEDNLRELGLTGSYLYLQLRSMPGKFFSVYLDVVTDTGMSLRLAFSNMFKTHKVSLRSASEPQRKSWACFCVHLACLNIRSRLVGVWADAAVPLPVLGGLRQVDDLCSAFAL